MSQKEIIIHDQCPCCHSNQIEKELSSENGEVKAYCTCNACNSKFVYNYSPNAIDVTRDAMGVQQMCNDKDVIVFALKQLALQSIINDNMVVTDRVRFMCNDLVAYLNNVDSDMLEENFQSSCYKRMVKR